MHVRVTDRQKRSGNLHDHIRHNNLVECRFFLALCREGVSRRKCTNVNSGLQSIRNEFVSCDRRAPIGYAWPCRVRLDPDVPRAAAENPAGFCECECAVATLGGNPETETSTTVSGALIGVMAERTCAGT